MEKRVFKLLIKIPIFTAIGMMIIMFLFDKSVEISTHILLCICMNLPIAVVLIVLYIITNLLKKEKEDKFKGYCLEPNSKYTPAMAAYIIDNVLERPESVFATVLDLFIKKYIKIKRVNQRLQIIVQKEMPDLYYHEKYVINSIKNNTKINLKDFEQCVIRDCEDQELIYKKDNLFTNMLIKIRKMLPAIGLILILAAIFLIDIFPMATSKLILLGVLCPIISYIGKFLIAEYNKTIDGQLFSMNAKGLKNYLKDYTLLSEKDYDYSNIIDRYLAFAVALGEGKKIEELYLDNEINIKID